MKTPLLMGIALGAVFAVCSLAGAAVIFTTEAAGVQASTLPGLLTETFDSLPAGSLGTYVSPIGTYSSGAQIVPPDAYGGAGQTKYISVDAPSLMLAYTLTFNSPQSYFGLYWGAVDGPNTVTFLSQGNVVGQVTGGTISAGLDAAYLGNPSNGADMEEMYVYVNFSGTPDTTFDSVRFENMLTTGFETDNHSIVPEPMSMGLLAAGALAILRRRR